MTENIAGLVERLREMAPEEGRTIRCNDRTTAMMNQDIREAATALEEQQKLLEEAREALTSIACGQHTFGKVTRTIERGDMMRIANDALNEGASRG